MDHVELAEYLVEIEETMSDWDDPISLQFELDKLHNIIKQLMDDTFKEPNTNRKTLLACLEYKARNIRKYIIARNWMEN